ncbi:MAG: hypothetical protein SGILL_002372 [Bacillariaceae sp.]
MVTRNASFVSFLVCLLLVEKLLPVEAFAPYRQSLQSSSHSALCAGRGFGKGNQDKKEPLVKKSYGKEELLPIKDLIDEESGMKEFFSSNEEWHPLFRSLASHSSVPAMSFMESAGEEFEFHETTKPWRRLDAIPTLQEEKTVLGQFLDAMQQSLIDIPVDETTKEDENDLHFLEEGRRMLVCQRFHVVQDMEKGSIDSFDNLFQTCWSEITELRQTNENDAGSLIVAPGMVYDDLRRFSDMNLQRPLQWLGIDGDFEVAVVERGGLGVVRLIHKLSEIPTDKYLPEQPLE